MRLRIALVSAALDQPTRGNHTTLRRWLEEVTEADLVAVPADATQELDPVPDVVHGYHALHGGRAALALARRHDRPLVVSLGGTDVFHPDSASVVAAADCVTGALAAFGDLFPAGTCYVTVPRGVRLPAAPTPRAPDGTLRALLVSGLRPVKDPLLALDLAARLRARGLPLTLRILGAALDAGYARALTARMDGMPFATWDEVPFEAMPAAYAEADVVWNTSLQEGGANALLEALAHGCAVFARDVTGNRELLGEGEAPPGMLFEPGDLDGAEAFHRALLAETLDQRRARAARAHDWLRAHHDPAAEVAALMGVWRRVARGRTGR